LEHTGMTLVREYVDAHGPRLIYALPGRPPLPQTRRAAAAQHLGRLLRVVDWLLSKHPLIGGLVRLFR
jgi:hypothetical protein